IVASPVSVPACFRWSTAAIVPAWRVEAWPHGWLSAWSVPDELAQGLPAEADVALVLPYVSEPLDVTRRLLLPPPLAVTLPLAGPVFGFGLVCWYPWPACAGSLSAPVVSLA